MSGLLPRPRKSSAACFESSDPSEIFKQLVSAFPRRRKPSNNLFRPFRCVGNLQATCFGLSEASETFKQLVSTFPMRRKPSSNLFRPIRCVGNLQRRVLVLSEALGRLRPPAKLAGYGFLRYPASFPASAGCHATVCLQPPLATRELTTAKPPNLQCERRSGGFFL